MGQARGLERQPIAMDIRDKTHITHEDVVGLNFIRSPNRFVFRQHFRQGLRSHVLEALDPRDVAAEIQGVESEGIRWFPRARPRRMLRLFRTRFDSLDRALREIERFRIVQTYLSVDQYAASDEFIVEYASDSKSRILLCGLQEYVHGAVLDPWSEALSLENLSALFPDLEPGTPPAAWRVQESAERFVASVKIMVQESGFVPDLAGIGNLILTPAGKIRLVDINNICRADPACGVQIDDKGYPVCDRSVQVLAILEEKLVGRGPDMSEPLYRAFLSSKRKSEAEELELKFFRKKKFEPLQQPFPLIET